MPDCWSIGRYVLISSKNAKLHFHAPMGALGFVHEILMVTIITIWDDFFGPIFLSYIHPHYMVSNNYCPISCHCLHTQIGQEVWDTLYYKAVISLFFEGKFSTTFSWISPPSLWFISAGKEKVAHTTIVNTNNNMTCVSTCIAWRHNSHKCWWWLMCVCVYFHPMVTIDQPPFSFPPPCHLTLTPL